MFGFVSNGLGASGAPGVDETPDQERKRDDPGEIRGKEPVGGEPSGLSL